MNVSGARYSWSKLLKSLGMTLAMGLSLSGCLSTESEDASLFAQSCSVPEDQKGSFMARVQGLPIQLYVDSEFSTSQRDAIQMAVAQWNLTAQQVLKRDVFEVHFASLPSGVRSMDPTDCGQNIGPANQIPVVRERFDSSSNPKYSTHWEKTLKFTPSIPAATFRCEEGAKVVHQMIYFFPELVGDKQVASVMVHELGHAIGLDHSCYESSGQPDFKSCKGLDSTHAYRVAVMYPWLSLATSSNSGEIKDVLRSNDKIRGQCVMNNTP